MASAIFEQEEKTDTSSEDEDPTSEHGWDQVFYQEPTIRDNLSQTFCDICRIKHVKCEHFCHSTGEVYTRTTEMRTDEEKVALTENYAGILMKKRFFKIALMLGPLISSHFPLIYDEEAECQIGST